MVLETLLRVDSREMTILKFTASGCFAPWLRQNAHLKGLQIV